MEEKQKMIEEEKQRKKEEEERKKRIKESMLQSIPEQYPDLYPLTRKMKRHFVLHIGPTNSGKTYEAMQRIREKGEGIYLAPLRLLAFEQYESLNADGYLCNLITGEEQEIIPGAKIQTSTVEMMSPVKEYSVAVIDEAQMLADKDRGWAGTAAILGLCCPEIHICAAPHAKDLIIRLIEECADTYEVSVHTRKTQLVADMSKFRFPRDVKKGDALIVFSKRNVHAVAYELRQRGFSCSIIYGNLPYDVRQAEARKFSEGETDVLVSTDAIGMGLNLPIERVVFLEVTKYDGKKVRDLLPEEAQQIAGRAGRLGIFETGYFNALDRAKFVRRLMGRLPATIQTASIGFPESLVTCEGSLSEILTQWEKIPPKEGYQRMDVTTILELTKELEKQTDNKKLIYAFVTMPFNPDGLLLDVWREMFQREIKGKIYTLKKADRHRISCPAKVNLDHMETAYKICDLLYAYFVRFDHPEEIKAVLSLKKEISKQILKELFSHGLSPRKCKHCGRVLPWNYGYGMCNKCYEDRYGGYWDYDDYDYD